MACFLHVQKLLGLPLGAPRTVDEPCTGSHRHALAHVLVHLRHQPLANSIASRELAGKLHGYVPRKLAQDTRVAVEDDGRATGVFLATYN